MCPSGLLSYWSSPGELILFTSPACWGLRVPFHPSLDSGALWGHGQEEPCAGDCHTDPCSMLQLGERF